ncbi:MAG: hypothetical protein KJ971_00695 [Firmicutes bacterium]|nr:hypothetical protein [Bacillota bacterium]
MKHCDKCQVDVDTTQKYCPLCHQLLKGEGDLTNPELYPEYIPQRRQVLPLTKKILLFVTVIAIVTLIGINLFDGSNTFWSLIPLGAILYFWTIVRYGILSKQNIAFKLAFLTSILIIILNLVDQAYGDVQGWALNYVTPMSLLACNLAISFIIWIKRINYRDYLFYLMTIIIFSIIPIVLYLFDVITILWPSITALGLAVFILLFIIFFFPKSIKDEIKKRFHL